MKGIGVSLIAWRRKELDMIKKEENNLSFVP